MTEVILTAVLTGAITSVGGTLLTVAALRVHVEYIKQATEDNKKAIIRAHERIDEIKNVGNNHIRRGDA